MSSLWTGARGAIAFSLSAIFFLGVVAPSGAQAETLSPWWHLTSRMIPSALKPGGEGTIAVTALNVGDAPTVGAVTVSDVLPAGVSVVREGGVPEVSGGVCGVVGVRVTCSEESPRNPFEDYEIRVTIKAGASTEPNLTRVTGGGASSVSIVRPVAVSEAPVPFGIEEFTLSPEEEGGAVDTRAGSHPFQLTTTITFNRSSTEVFEPPGLPRNVVSRLPAGQIANAAVVPQCDAEDFSTVSVGYINHCPSDTAVGAVVVALGKQERGREEHVTVPLFNLAPAYGEPVRFGFEVYANPVILDTSVRSGPGEDYGVTVTSANTTEIAAFLSATLTFWGAPDDPRHNSARDWGCIEGEHYHALNEELTCIPSVDTHPPAYLTLPTNCSAPYATTLETSSWPTSEHPEGVEAAPVSYQLQDAAGNPLSLTGCNQLAFSPQVSAQPSSQSASSPSGLDLNVNFDDEGLLAAEGVAQSQMKDTEVVFPEGLTVNPSSGVGLAGCTEADYARETLESPPGAGCPNESKLGTVEAETPLLTQKIKGNIFIAQPYENPFGSLIAIYIVLKNPETGVLVRLAGKVTPNPVTGQLTTTVENVPQFPVSHFNFHFREGQQAPLITPAACGGYTTVANLTPWAEPLSVLKSESRFQISSGVGGGPCPSGGTPFDPQIIAGTLSNGAGSFSPLDLRITRGDADQEISSFSTTLAPGLTGVLAGIPLCPEADIEAARHRSGRQEEAEPSCPAASQLGHSLVGTGVGSVLAYTPGRIYLAGPYDGDPFSLVSVTSAVVGPFDLGTVVVRFGLRIDPATAQVSTDQPASEPIPTIIKGIVTHVRDIRVYIDRPGFTLNPTSCTPAAVDSTVTGNQGASANISSRFQAAGCSNLKFQPALAVSTAGRASKSGGSSLHFKISYPKNAIGSQSWMKEMKFDIPKQLPARLTTIQKACLAKVFETERQNCPKASVIGQVVVHTPVLSVPLEGPLYFVSYGGAAFPDAVAVIKGDGITIESHGHTFINGKTGVTSATFESVPDVPFESIEVTVPQGPYSEFGANLPHGSDDFCGQKLVMPVRFKAQNGLEITQSTPVAVTGCPKALTKAQKLAAALKACHKKHGKKRAACEKAARKAYGPRNAKRASNNRRAGR